MKIVLNKCYGGFSLSEEAYAALDLEWDGYGFLYDTLHVERHNDKLVEVVERLGDKANGLYSELRITEIPDGVDYEIEEYDGIEWVAEKHRTWA